MNEDITVITNNPLTGIKTTSYDDNDRRHKQTPTNHKHNIIISFILLPPHPSSLIPPHPDPDPSSSLPPY